jgi:hypothetical protein
MFVLAVSKTMILLINFMNHKKKMIKENEIFMRRKAFFVKDVRSFLENVC